ncbi:hypothetical protein A9Q98_08510 [Thalassotalea sp. 42_200_T64]|nr:hypothetical protein A9Q98_08510 [Thalassotalea sp. 42_200_T64]
MSKNYGFNLLKTMFLSMALVQPNVSAAPVPADAQLQHQLQKKLQLIDYILIDIEKKSAELFANEPMFADSYQYCKNEVNLARKALAKGDNKAAKDHLDQAFINMTYARSFIQKTAPTAAVSLQEYKKLQQSVTEFSHSLRQTLADKTDSWGLQQQLQVKQIVSRADTLFAEQKMHAAKRQLEDAYRMLVMTLTRLKDKQTTVISLDFETPQDECDYEFKRLASFQMLVKMRKNNSKLSVKKLAKIDSHVAMADTKAKRASALADKRQYVEAIKLLEQANEQLKRALRMTGLNIL